MMTFTKIMRVGSRGGSINEALIIAIKGDPTKVLLPGGASNRSRLEDYFDLKTGDHFMGLG